MSNLPIELRNRILLWNSHPLSNIIKKEFQEYQDYMQLHQKLWMTHFFEQYFSNLDFAKYIKLMYSNN